MSFFVMVLAFWALMSTSRQQRQADRGRGAKRGTQRPIAPANSKNPLA